ncbi:tRNA pseudouridine(13) synthase TruD [Deinococcus misasensis]|uniref:tRNA pseudouridine(13) synthase TruD n=1 Tax=Deinococcus misasensis TaxID=392413 RepID=UPI0006924B26|nr:tRNA pseudouridine(13) synthase TruD [Deinococcus misasensis]
MSLLFNWDDLAYITTDLPGTGGRIRSEIADFQVDEVPAYPFSGEGDFLYLHIEKIGQNSNHVVKMLGEQLGVRFDKVGVAGLKDRHAITTQWISLPARYEKQLDALDMPGVRILETTRHNNKLGIGHLKGNQFSIRVRDADASHVPAVLEALKPIGIPNYYGPQRFGLQGKNAEMGLDIARKNFKGKASTPVRRFLISSVQSLLFNGFLSRRIERGIYDQLILGDMAKKHDTGGVFLVESLDESPRALRGEVSATGTLYGRKIKPLTLDAGALEQEVLAEFGVTLDDFRSRLGDRRITRLFTDIDFEPTEDGYWLRFFLPKGAFATSVLREVMKVSVDTSEEDDASEPTLDPSNPDSGVSE